MSLFAVNPNLGQKILGTGRKTPPLKLAFVARWLKSPIAPVANNVIDTQLLPASGTTVVSTGVNEVQSIALGAATGGSYSLALGGQVTAGTSQVTNVDVGTSTGGTFTLTILGQTTSALAFNITKANLQTALQALSSVGSGNVLVTGTDGGQSGTPFILTFAGALANVPITVTGNSASLTGGTHTLTIASATPGVGIAFNATAATIQSALQALSTIGTGNVTVTGSVGGPFTVTFTGTLAKQGVALLTVVDGTTGGTGVVLTRTTNGTASALDVARNLTCVANVSGVTGNVVVAGTNLNGDAITETLALNGTTTVTGNKAFATVTQITFPTRTHSNDTVSVGVGSKLGLHHKQTNDTVFRTHYNNVIEGTAPTVAFSATALESNTVTLNSSLTGSPVDFYYLISS